MDKSRTTLTKPSLVDYAAQFVELRRHGRELTGPCPICQAGDDRFNIRADRSGWLCRQCTPQGGGVFDLIARVENISVAQAMANHRAHSQPPTTQTTKIQPVNSQYTLDDTPYKHSDWQHKAERMVCKSETALPGSPAMEYLLTRGIDIETAKIYRLGYNPAWPTKYDDVNGRLTPTETVPALVIPWIRESGIICALKVRLIGDRPHHDRFRQMRGSRQEVFGEHLGRHHDRAILVEGELNAISIKMAHPNADVLSFGGDTNTSELERVATSYQSILVWLDNPERTERFQSELAHVKKQSATYMISPDKNDANDLLQKFGVKFLAELIRRIAPGYINPTNL